MKFQIGRTNLVKIAQAMARYDKQVLKTDILQLLAEDEYLTLIMTDTERGIKARVPISNFEHERDLIFITIGTFVSALKEMSKETTLIKTEENALKISNDDFEISLPVQNFEPVKFPETKTEFKYDVFAEDVIEMIPEVLPAVDKKSTHLALQGLAFDCMSNEFNIVGTDSHRLAISNAPGAGDLCKFSIFKDEADVLQRILKVIGDEEISILIGDTQVVFKTTDLVMIIQPLNGEYPDYSSVMPEKFISKALIDKKQLAGALKRITSVEKNTPVKFDFRDNVLELSIDSATFQMHESLDINYEGELINLKYNSKLFVDGLKQIDTDLVEFKLSGLMSAALMTPEGDDYFKYLIMPTFD